MEGTTMQPRTASRPSPLPVTTACPAPPTSPHLWRPLSAAHTWKRLLIPLALSLLAASLCAVRVSGTLVLQPPVQGHVHNVYLPVVAQSLQAYGLTQPAFAHQRMELTQGVNVDQAVKAVQSGKYDYVVMTSSVPPAYRMQLTGIKTYPIMINAACPFYNLPTAAGADTLAMRMLHMCQILRGNITRWNDPRLQASNPTLTLPNQNITIVALGFGSDSLLTVSTLCTKIDPVWATSPGLGVTNSPRIANYIPSYRLKSMSPSQSLSGLGSTILDTPYSFAVAPQSAATAASNLRYVALINQADVSVLPTQDSLAQAFLELSARGVPEGKANFDLTNPQSATGWPLTMCGWVWIHSTAVASTCASKRAAVQFLSWMYSSPVVARASEATGTPMIPELFLRQSDLLGRMGREILCGNNPLQSSSAGSVGTPASIQGLGLVAGPLTFLSQMYSGVDPSLQYAFSTLLDDGLVLQRVSANEVDVGMVAPAGMRDEQVRAFMAPVELVGGVPRELVLAGGDELGNNLAPQGAVSIEQGGMIIPTFLNGVVATFALPTAIASIGASWTATTLYGPAGGERTLPQLYPLRATLDFLSRAVMGGVSSWLDPELVHWNPQLLDWFNVTGAPTPLRTVVCCSDKSDPMVATTVLVRSLMRTRYFASLYGDVTLVEESYQLPIVAYWDFMALSPDIQMIVDREPRMAGKQVMEPGTISYKMLTSPHSNPNTDFQIVVPGGDPASAELVYHPDDDTVAASTASIAACVEGIISDPPELAAMLDPLTGRHWSGEIKDPLTGKSKRVKGCYPLTAVTSLALPRSATNGGQNLVPGQAAALTAGGCARARKNLEFAAWLHTAPLLSNVAGTNGIVRLSDYVPLRIHALSMLNSATCDGKNILITLPIIWSMPTAAHVVSIVTACIMLLLVIVSATVLYKYRNLSVIRGSSPLFLAMGLGGLTLCAVSLVVWTGEVTSARCTSFMWVVNLGFTLVFAPLFAKTWRIYQIFSGKKIKIVKISNHKLGAVVAVVVLVDVVLLAIWTGVSPLKPVLFIRDPTTLDGAFEHTTMCAPEGDAGYALLAVEAVFKGALLFFGALMGFSTRKVASAYNESSGIAWSIYNTVLAGVVVAGLIASLDTIGDTLIWLVLFLLLWVMFCTWAFIFIPKGQGIVAVVYEGKSDALTDMMSSTGMTSGGYDASHFSFMSVTGMSKDRLLMYAKSLDTHVQQVRRRVQALNLSGLAQASFGKESQPQQSPVGGTGSVSQSTRPRALVNAVSSSVMSPYVATAAAATPNPQRMTTADAQYRSPTLQSRSVVGCGGGGGGGGGGGAGVGCGDTAVAAVVAPPSPHQSSTRLGVAHTGTTHLASGDTTSIRRLSMPSMTGSKNGSGRDVSVRGAPSDTADPAVPTTATVNIDGVTPIRVTVTSIH